MTMHNTTIEVPATLNGIETEGQSQTMGAIRENPEMGEVRFRAVNRWRGGARTRSGIAAFDAAGARQAHLQAFTVDTDLPQGFQGADSAPAPTEHALQALAACMTTTMVYNCAARGIEVRSVESEVEGQMNASGFLQLGKPARKGFSQVRLGFKIDADASENELQSLLQSSPLFDVFTNGVPVSVNLDTA